MSPLGSLALPSLLALGTEGPGVIHSPLGRAGVRSGGAHWEHSR